MSENIDASLKVYELFRDRIKHQDVLISHRLGYFLIMQSALVLGLTSDRDPKWLFQSGLPLIGWLLAFGLLFSIYFAFSTIEMAVVVYNQLGSSSNGSLTGVKSIALAPIALNKSNASYRAMPPLRSACHAHVLGHTVAWLVTFSALVLWPFVFLGGSHGSGDIISGRANSWWFLCELVSVGTFLVFLIRHIFQCRKNDRDGVGGVGGINALPPQGPTTLTTNSEDRSG